jgi:hypothetical protein
MHLRLADADSSSGYETMEAHLRDHWSTLPPMYTGPVDPMRGYLNMMTFWQPNPKDPDPDSPGLKKATALYLLRAPDESCLCGSGRTFRECCQQRHYWCPICPNPGMDGYSLVAPQTAAFGRVDRTIVTDRLMADARLYCTINQPDSGFWVLWGDPAMEHRYGIVCFGDVELRPDDMLVASAMSPRRMDTLLEALRQAGEGVLPQPRVTQERTNVLDRRTGKTVEVDVKELERFDRRERRRHR